MSGWEIKKPVTVQQQAEEARRRNEELYNTIPLRPPVRLNPAAKAFVPRAQGGAPAINSNVAGKNNSPRNTNFISHEGAGVANTTDTTANHATGDEVMGLIKHLTQGYPHQERICELFQTLQNPGQLSPFQLNPAIVHRQATSTGDSNPGQPTPAVKPKGADRLNDAQATSVQPASEAVPPDEITPVQPAIATAAPMDSNSAADLGYRYAIMFVTMRERGFEVAQISAAMRVAENNPDRTHELLLDTMPATTRNNKAAATQNGGLSQASPVQPASLTTTTKGAPTGHTTALQSAPTPHSTVAPKAGSKVSHATRSQGEPNEFLGVCRSFQRAMHQANTEAARAPRRALFDPTKYSKKNRDEQ